jgi:GNAT superfamily N-acetyltransferase
LTVRLIVADVRLRPAVPADIPVLRELIIRSARGLSSGYYTPVEIEAAIEHVFGVDSRLIDDGTYFVADLDGEVAGCGGWSFRRTLYGGDQRPIGNSDRLDPCSDPARIRAFFVAPRAARRGIGRRILERCEAAARVAGFRSLELMSTLPGVPFYAALGFKAEEEVADALPNGVALRFVRMSRAL